MPAAKTIAFLLFALLALAGCGAAAEIPLPPTLTPPEVLPKRLATVFISPTPDEAQMAATRAAVVPTTAPILLPTATATPYIGVFLGEAEAVDGAALFGPAALALPSPIGPTAVGPQPICPAQADVLFGDRWTADAAAVAALGCPTEAASSFTGSAQVFERGVMLYWPSGEIWAIAPRAERYWYTPSAPAVAPGEIAAPEGLLAPALGFGAVWRGLPGVQEALGYAQTPEQGSQITRQAFQNGALLAEGGSGQVFLLLADGRALGPY